jgi:hypothetical protein
MQIKQYLVIFFLTSLVIFLRENNNKEPNETLYIYSVARTE